MCTLYHHCRVYHPGTSALLLHWLTMGRISTAHKRARNSTQVGLMYVIIITINLKETAWSYNIENASVHHWIINIGTTTRNSWNSLFLLCVKVQNFCPMNLNCYEGVLLASEVSLPSRTMCMVFMFLASEVSLHSRKMHTIFLYIVIYHNLYYLHRAMPYHNF